MTTYIQMVNKLARRINEVEIPADAFGTVRGVHAMLKDAIVDTLSQISQTKYKLPLYAMEGEQTLIIGQTDYDFPARWQSVDWNSFQVQPEYLDVDLNTQRTNSAWLAPIEREQYYRYFRDMDTDLLPDGRDKPQYVFSNHDAGFSVMPAPNQEYVVKYKYFLNPVTPVLADDPIMIPAEFEYVIMAAALYHAYLFLDNNERATMSQETFKQGMKDMTIALLGNNYQHMYDGRVRF